MSKLMAQKNKNKFSKINLSFFLTSTYYRLCSTDRLFREMYTPIDEAVLEIKRRYQDEELKKRVYKYLKGEVPAHFLDQAPIFYLSRFLATPNYELYHVKKQTEKYNLPLVVGEDHKSKFVPQNDLKWSLAKLPVVKAFNRKNDEIIEHFTIVDFSINNNKLLCDINTKCNKSLVDFHRELFNHSGIEDVIVRDESAWIDRTARQDIFQQYKNIWSLVSVFGILLESFTPNEQEFYRDIVFPSFKEVEQILGVKPLIVEHISSEYETRRNWNSYPIELYPDINNLCKNI